MYKLCPKFNSNDFLCCMISTKFQKDKLFADEKKLKAYIMVKTIRFQSKNSQ